MLEIVVHDIKGKCPMYKTGDRIVIDDPTLFLFLKKRKPVLKEKTKKNCFFGNGFLWKSVVKKGGIKWKHKRYW